MTGREGVRKNVAIVSRAWYPNHQLLFEEVQSILGDRAKIHYFLLSEKESRRPWSLTSKSVGPILVPGIHLKAFSKEAVVNTSLRRHLDKANPSLIIVTPWSEMGCFLAKRYGRKRGIPTIGWTVGLREWNPTVFWRMRSALTKALLRRFVKEDRFVFVDGVKAKRDVLELAGVSEDKIVVVKHVINERHFDYANHPRNHEYVQHQRSVLTLDERPLFVCVSQLVQRKGIDSLLRAFMKLLQDTKDVQLLLVGDGPLRALAQQWLELCPANFKWLPSVPYDQVPMVYAIADYCVVPSYFDDWCNVVNESLCGMVPVLCSDGACAAYDLIRHGETGLMYRGGDVDSLHGLMLYALGNKAVMRKMAENGYRFVRTEWNTAESARIWAKYILIALDDDRGGNSKQSITHEAR